MMRFWEWKIFVIEIVDTEWFFVMSVYGEAQWCIAMWTR